MKSVLIESASAAELESVRSLLSASDLPMDDLEQHLPRFLVAKWQCITIGTVGLELAGEAALLRSLCVAPAHRGQGVGARLLAAMERDAHGRGAPGKRAPVPLPFDPKKLKSLSSA